VMAASAVAATVASAWLIPAYGLDGAAAALMISALLQLAGTILILMKIDRSLRSQAPAPLAMATCAEGAAR